VCFSAEADLVGGLIVGAVGIDAMRHARRPHERLLATLPLVFAAHQLIESVVWWGLEGRVDDTVWHAARWLYLAIAFGLLPVLAPIAVGGIERVTHRAHTAGFAALGAVVATVLMYSIIRGPVTAVVEGRHIAYTVELWHGWLIVFGYVVATCGSLLISSHPHVRWFGIANLVAVVFLAWLDQSAFISLWCAWAAVTSIAIAVHLRFVSAPERRPGAAGADGGELAT
jgi:hypothetical protein